jgi:dipeptidyl aminopeptidase/acylaminoacyl peptidase
MSDAATGLRGGEDLVPNLRLIELMGEASALFRFMPYAFSLSWSRPKIDASSASGVTRRHVRFGCVVTLASGLLACSPPPLETRVTGSSADGLVFVRLVHGVKDIARARIRDGAVAPLLETPDREEDWPYWSDAAGRLLLQVKPLPKDARSDLVLWNPADGSEHPLAASVERNEQWAMWSKDGRAVVYAFGGKSPASGIGVIDVGSGLVRLAATAGARDFFFRPHFAPDGLSIAAQRRWADSPGSSLWLLQVDSPPRAFRDDRNSFYQKQWFTRDGGSIVYTMKPTAGGLREIYLSAATPDSTPRALAPDAAADDHSAIPSPVRDEVAFVSNRAGSMDIFLVDLSGGEPRNLTQTPDIDEYAPHWSPDGTRIVATAEPAHPRPPGAGDDLDLEQATVLVIDREGKKLLETPGFMPDWMPAWP